MLAQNFASERSLNLKTPAIFVKRDGAEYPFRLFKLELVAHALDLDEVKDELLVKILGKLNAHHSVLAKEVATAFHDSLNELGYLDEAKAYLEYRQEDEVRWQEETNTKKRLERMIQKDPTIVNENANKDSDVFSTQRDLTAGVVGNSFGQMVPELDLLGQRNSHHIDWRQR